MGKQLMKQVRKQYTMEFKLEAVRLVKGGQRPAATAKLMGISPQTLEAWLKRDATGALRAVGGCPICAEQMEISRLRAALARVTMERDILKRATGAQRRVRRPDTFCEVRLD